MSKLLLTLAAVSSFLVSGVAQAQSRGASRTHDGFFLQLDLGVGGMSTSASDSSGDELKLSGTAAEFSVALGYALTPNFILAGQFWGTSTSDPEVEFNGTTFGNVSGDLGLSAFGVNLTYYFMPINIYVSATPSIGVLTAKSGSQSSDTNAGFALKLAAGKEWWVSDNWGIGLNLQYAYGSNEDSDLAGAPTWGTNWFGVAFSATYN